MARLTRAARAKLSKSEFANKPKAGTAEGKKKPGSYPIPDANHARLALAMVAKHGTPSEKARVRAAVHKKYPKIQHKDDGGAVADDKKSSGGSNAMGWISELINVAEGIGKAGKSDYDTNNRNDDGTIKNEGKFMVGNAIGAVLDPGTFAMNLIKGDAFWNEPAKAKKLAAQAKIQKTNTEAVAGNQVASIANNDRLAQLGKGLKDGGVVTGKSGVDTNARQVKPQSFVIPKESASNPVVKKIAKQLGLMKPLPKKTGDTPVKLTKGEILVPPNKTKTFDSLLKVKGIKGLASLAPNADNTSIGKAYGGWTNDKETRMSFLENQKKRTSEEEQEYSDLTKAWNDREKNAKAENMAKYTTDENAHKGSYPNFNDTNLQQQYDNISGLNRTMPIKGNGPAGSKSPTSNDPSRTAKEKSGNGNYLAEGILSGVQGVMSGVAMAGMGKAPIMNESDWNEITRPSETPLANNALSLLRMSSTYGINPNTESNMMKQINEMAANSVPSKTLSGNPAEAFNQSSLASKNAMDAIVNLKAKSAEMQEGKVNEFAKAELGFQPVMLEQDNANKLMKLRKMSMKQDLWDKENGAYAGLMNAGLSNAFNASRMNDFWGKYSQYMNPYQTS